MKKILLIIGCGLFMFQDSVAVLDRETQDEENLLRYTLKNSFGMNADFEKIFNDALEKYKQKWLTPKTSSLFSTYEKAFKEYAKTVIDFMNSKIHVDELHVAEENLDKADRLISQSNGK